MKYIRILSCLLVLSIILFGCSGTPGIPKIELNTSSFDLGDIQPDNGNRTETFNVKNSGGAPLNILGVSTSCGCTKAEIRDDVIPPGSETQLTVVYDPSVHPNLVGTIKRIVYIKSNDPAHEEVELELVGNVLPSASQSQQE